MIKIDEEVKRWAILDRFTGKIINLTDQQFGEDLKNNIIELRGRFVLDKFNRNVWIDGIIKK